MSRVALRMAAMCSHGSDDAMEVSQSLASLRQRPSHAKVRSTTQRRAMTTKPAALSGRRTILIAGLGSKFSMAQ